MFHVSLPGRGRGGSTGSLSCVSAFRCRKTSAGVYPCACRVSAAGSVGRAAGLLVYGQRLLGLSLRLPVAPQLRKAPLLALHGEIAATCHRRLRSMLLARSLRKMAGNNTVLNRLEQRASEADQVIEYLKQQVTLLKEKAILQASQREEKKLRVENAKLKKEIEGLKEQLTRTEIQNGVKQVTLPTSTSIPTSHTAAVSKLEKQPEPVIPVVPATKEHNKGSGTVEEKKKKEKNEKKGEKKDKKQPAVADDDSKSMDISRLDLRVGCIVSAKKHPDADSLYVEEVDVGESAPRTVVSGLVKHVSLEQMQNRMAVMLCNLKPAKMRGVVSQAMVMCASSPDKVEILDPPSGAVPGDRISFQTFPGEPEKELNPKKKIWEQIQPDLHTDEQCVATYKGVPFEVKGKGVCKAQTMSKSGIK